MGSPLLYTGNFHQGVRHCECADNGAGGVVGDLWQAPSLPLIGGAACAGATRLRLRGGAKLVRLRRDQNCIAQPHGACCVADKLVYCHEALHLKAKLQKASYHQVAEKWLSDSDSDESDEEDLKK